MTKYQIKRIYDEASEEDGYRVLVDRLWPRGVSKERARLDSWNKDIAPSSDLRKWFAHDPEKFKEFTAITVLLFYLYSSAFSPCYQRLLRSTIHPC